MRKNYKHFHILVVGKGRQWGTAESEREIDGRCQGRSCVWHQAGCTQTSGPDTDPSGSWDQRSPAKEASQWPKHQKPPFRVDLGDREEERCPYFHFQMSEITRPTHLSTGGQSCKRTTFKRNISNVHQIPEPRGQMHTFCALPLFLMPDSPFHCPSEPNEDVDGPLWSVGPRTPLTNQEQIFTFKVSECCEHLAQSWANVVMNLHLLQSLKTALVQSEESNMQQIIETNLNMRKILLR